MELTFAFLSLAAGAGLTLQAGANAQLAKAVGSPFTATALQLLLGALLLAALAAATGQIGQLARLGEARPWHALGGVASALYVVSTILLYPRIGAVLAVGLIITGQMAASLALDLFGLFGLAVRAPDIGMAAGGLAILLGAAAIVVAGRCAGPTAGFRPGWLVLGLAAGAVLPVQGAVNNLLRADLGAPIAVAVVSFAVATLAMVPVVLSNGALSRSVAAGPAGLGAMPWWGWLGAVAGAIYVTAVFISIPVIGASATVGLTVLGQQSASLAVDHYGLFRLPARKISAVRLAGVGLLMLGVFCVRFL